MNVVHFPSLEEIELHSPSRKFHSFCRNVSLALGGIRNVGTWGGGHPFDVQIRRVPAGAAICPYHSHLGQWEFFLVRSGSGTVRVDGETHVIRTGDFFVHPPGVAHQVFNTGNSDLEILIVADNPQVDGCFYPDSNKWALRPPSGLFFRLTEVDYFDGEDPLAPTSPLQRQTLPPRAENARPFSSRKLHIDQASWEEWGSPAKKFHGTSKELSMALGAKRNTPTGLGGHPFEVEFGKLAPGERGCPFHYHAAQWELFLFLEGTATVRAGAESRVLRAGDVVLHPPFEAHDFTNTGETELTYLLIADNPPADYWHYPDSKKWGLRKPRTFFRMQEVEYYDGEES
jgi:uncharacterized cupin superfamily protein